MKKVLFLLILNFVTFFAIGQKSTKEIYLQLSQIEYQVDSLYLFQKEEDSEVLFQTSLFILELIPKMQKLHEENFPLNSLLAKKYGELQDKVIVLVKKLNSYLE